MGVSLTRISFVARVGDKEIERDVFEKRTDVMFLVSSDTLALKEIEVVGTIKGSAKGELHIIDVAANKTLLEQTLDLKEPQSGISNSYSLNQLVKIKPSTLFCLRLEVEGKPTYTYAEDQRQFELKNGTLIDVNRDPKKVNTMGGLKNPEKIPMLGYQNHDTNMITGIQFENSPNKGCC